MLSTLAPGVGVLSVVVVPWSWLMPIIKAQLLQNMPSAQQPLNVPG